MGPSCPGPFWRYMFNTIDELRIFLEENLNEILLEDECQYCISMENFKHLITDSLLVFTEEELIAEGFSIIIFPDDEDRLDYINIVPVKLAEEKTIKYKLKKYPLTTV